MFLMNWRDTNVELIEKIRSTYDVTTDLDEDAINVMRKGDSIVTGYTYIIVELDSYYALIKVDPSFQFLEEIEGVSNEFDVINNLYMNHVEGV